MKWQRLFGSLAVSATLVFAGVAHGQSYDVLLLMHASDDPLDNDDVSYFEPYTSFFEGAGHSVVLDSAYAGTELSSGQITEINENYDLVFMPNTVSSGDYDTTDWNQVEAGIMTTGGFWQSSARWNWYPTGYVSPTGNPSTLNTEVGADHPLLQGVTVNDGQVSLIDTENDGMGRFVTFEDAGFDNGIQHGQMILSRDGEDQVTAAIWDTGPFFDDGPEAAFRRSYWGINFNVTPTDFFADLTPDGEQFLHNMVHWTAVPEPGTAGVVLAGSLLLLARRRRKLASV